MANALAGVNGLVKKKQNEQVASLLKFMSLGERGATKTFKEKTTKILELAAHGLETGNVIVATKLSSEANGLVTGRLYTVKKVSTSEIELEEHSGGGVLTWTAFGTSENQEVQQLKEAEHVKERIAITWTATSDGVTEEAESKAIETTAAQEGQHSLTDVLYYEKSSGGEILGGWALPSKLEETAAAVITVLKSKQSNLVAP